MTCYKHINLDRFYCALDLTGMVIALLILVHLPYDALDLVASKTYFVIFQKAFEKFSIKTK